MKKICILGISGSIGKQTLEVVEKHPELFNLVSCSVHENVSFAKSLSRKYPKLEVAVTSKDNNILKIIKKADIVVNGISGTAGINPSIMAIKEGKTLVLANKETVVCLGDHLNKLLKENPQAKLISVDSEHNALMQCLKGENKDDIDELIITASGGPFKDLPIKKFKKITVEDALNHPSWKMGKKITIDSATMFNKGLEILEAHYLFNVDFKNIKAAINPHSLVHSLVRFKDGSIKALLSTPSMKLPILEALTDRKNRNDIKPLDLINSTISFEEIDLNKFSAVSLAYKVGSKGGNMPLTYCVADEVAVTYFLNNKIKFTEIYEVVKETINKTKFIKNYKLEDITKLIEEVKTLTTTIIERRI